MVYRSKRFRVADESTRADHGDKGSEPVSVCRNSYIALFIYLFGFLFFFAGFHFYCQYKFAVFKYV